MILSNKMLIIKCRCTPPTKTRGGNFFTLKETLATVWRKSEVRRLSDNTLLRFMDHTVQSGSLNEKCWTKRSDKGGCSIKGLCEVEKDDYVSICCFQLLKSKTK